jgi:hypothetical protein
MGPAIEPTRASWTDVPALGNELHPSAGTPVAARSTTRATTWTASPAAPGKPEAGRIGSDYKAATHDALPRLLPRLREEAKAMCARHVGRSCGFGTDASLKAALW